MKNSGTKLFSYLRLNSVFVLLFIIFILLSLLSDNFLSFTNLINIINQNSPLAIISIAVTLVIISGGFDLSTGAIFGVASITSAWIAVNVDPILGLLSAPFIGMLLGAVNGLLITGLKIHSFLATLATGLVFSGVAIALSKGFLIPVRIDSFTWLGREKLFGVHVAVFVFIAFALFLGFLLNRTKIGRYIFAVGGNEEASILSGIDTNKIKIFAFALSGMASGIAGAISTSRISMGQPLAGAGMELQAIAAVILGGTSIYGGIGGIWRTIAGVLLLALINNGFNLLNLDPFYKDLTTGLIIVLAISLSSIGLKQK